jgi:predicted AlkP superfamily phosphohydrolase/phosphomutase/tetratricopeptide (TPR) repeat protein
MTAKRVANRVLLIGWDAADWEHISPLLDAGKLPALEALINRGVMGNLATLRPVLSPMLWNSIATGKTADKHGILGFTEPLPSGRGIRPVASTTRTAKAVWNICHQRGLKSNVVAWWATHPAEPIDGVMVSNLFNGIRRSADRSLVVTPNTIHPAARTEELASLKIFPDELTPNDVLPFIPHANKIDQAKDSRLATLGKLISDCASIQAVTTQLLAEGPWDLTAVYFDAIDHFCHAFMAYHPPRMKNISEEDFEIYSRVVTGAYQFHDMLLQRLVQLAGDDATIIICSDHGFQSRHLRPLGTPLEPTGPAAWHRDLGIIVMAGPGIKRDERIYGANLIDVTPTILYQFGIPVGEDMDGRVLLDAFEHPHSPEFISSWEDVPGPCGRHTSVDQDGIDATSTSAADDDLIRQFVALGYIADPGNDQAKAARDCRRELDYNLARVYLSTNRFQLAQNILLSLVREAPWEDRFWKNLAACCFELGYYRQAQVILIALYRDTERPPAFALVSLARTSLALKEVDRAADYLRSALAHDPQLPMLHTTAGRIWRRLGHVCQAEEAFRRALELDPDDAHAYVGLASLYLAQRKYRKAADAALNAVTLLYRLPQAHWILGAALLRLRDWERAKLPFETLLHFRDERYALRARRCLARICRELGFDAEAAEHEMRAHERRSAHEQARLVISSSRETFLELPEVPGVSERRRALEAERPPHGRQRGKTPPQPSGRTLTIVSGLPRSGTSLMMQMLAAGGLPAKTDGQRPADVNNPAGYLEWEEIKQLPRRPELFDDPHLDGQAIKVISMLLPALPRRHRYKIIFMNRPLDEVAASQQRMIQQRGEITPRGTVEDMGKQLEEHRDKVQQWLARQGHCDVLTVDYPELIAHPAEQACRVAEFLGSTLLPCAERMEHVVRPELYRVRTP